MTVRIPIAASLIVFSARLLVGQVFEVASVKASPGSDRANVDASPAGRLTMDGSLAYCIKWAYDLRNYLLSGPEWLDTGRYHIAAKAPGPATVKDLKLMLQALLAEHFKLAVHREPKDLMVYALVVWKDGPKFKESQADGENVTLPNKRLGSGGTMLRTSMAQLAERLNGSCPDPIVDMTGLKGSYDFTLDISGYLGGIQPGDLPGILSEAMRAQLGLDLEHRKVPMEVLKVDHAEQVPVEN